MHKLRTDAAQAAGVKETSFIDEAEKEETHIVRHHTIYLDLEEKDKPLAQELMPGSDFFTKGTAKLVGRSDVARALDPGIHPDVRLAAVLLPEARRHVVQHVGKVN